MVETATAEPVVYISKTVLEPGTAQAGESFTMTVTLKNSITTKSIRNMLVTVDTGNVLIDLEEDSNILVINAVEDPIPMEEAFFDRAEIEMLRKVISTLPEIHRRRIILYFYKHLTYEKIAAQEGCSKVAVKYTLALSIEELRKKIKKFSQET